MDFGPAALSHATVRLVFKPYEEAKKEHVLDRFTQVRDEYANLMEETTSTRKLNMFTRFDTDMTDLLRVDPQNDPGRKYWYDMNKEQVKPAYNPPKIPVGIPAWAFLQVRDLGYLKYISSSACNIRVTRSRRKKTVNQPISKQRTKGRA
jgi:hypothetical protein